jgi:hypothetical protein
MKPNPYADRSGDNVEPDGIDDVAGYTDDEDFEADVDEEDEEEARDDPNGLAEDDTSESVPLEDDVCFRVYVCRNLTNTVDTRPKGYAWFSA